MNWLPFAKALRLLVVSVSKLSEPRQVAWAVAMGVAVGMVPKGNLLAVGLGVAMCSIRLNLLLAVSVAAVVTWAGHLLDPIFDGVGFAVLTCRPLRPIWTVLAEQPWADWLQFHNTVVMGSFLIAVAQIYPTMRASQRLAGTLLPRLTAAMDRSRLMKQWRRIEWSARLDHALDG